ncbi:MAG TPA: hypothetical protein VFF27_06185 [Bacteroidia bacterium]|jgi:hypothetical protein|nr:hypothetical protein [Bacteroidia bacterium]
MFKKLRTPEGRMDLTNYFCVFFLVAISGFPFFYAAQLNILFLFIFTLFIFFKRSIKFDGRAFKIMLFFYIVDILQVIIIKPFVPMTMLGTYTRLFVAFFVVALCGRQYTKYYSNIIYHLAIISLFFYIPCIASPAIRHFCETTLSAPFKPPFTEVNEFYERSPTIIIYNFHEVLAEFRNSGPFWEPGAFAIFIILALIFNLIDERTLWSKKNILLSIVLLTTLSTTGFVAFFVLVMSYYFATGNIIKNIFIMATVLPLAISLYFSLEFLSAKIEDNIAIAGEDKSSRFGSGLADITDWAKSPIIGWGRGAMRYGGRQFTFFTAEQHRNNGLTALLASYGIVIFLVLLGNYYKSLTTLCAAHSFNKSFAFFSFIVILLLGFSQTIFQYPFFYSLMFIHLMFTKKTELLR